MALGLRRRQVAAGSLLQADLKVRLYDRALQADLNVRLYDRAIPADLKVRLYGI